MILFLIISSIGITGHYAFQRAQISGKPLASGAGDRAMTTNDDIIASVSDTNCYISVVYVAKGGKT